MNDLFPICRSITGKGVRDSLGIINDFVNINIGEIPTGTKCYGWEVPKEWNIRDAYIANEYGDRIVDFKKNNLHLMGYSTPVNKVMTLDELHDHLLVSDPLEYRTSYYKENWGFSISEEQFRKICSTHDIGPKNKFKVVIDSTLTDGSLTYADKVLKGYSDKEYVFSTYCCHPSMGNDNLSGMIVWTLLLKYIESRKGMLSNNYRFVIAPETIGAIAYMSQHEKQIKKLSGGYTICSVGGQDPVSYKRTFKYFSYIDRISDRSLADLGYEDYKYYHYDGVGADERQFSSPGFRIPVGSIFKGECTEPTYKDIYHTSADNLNYISLDSIQETLGIYIKIVDNLEKDGSYIVREPHCEPMFSKYGLYDLDSESMACLRWLMFYSDGQHSLLEIAEKKNLEISRLYEFAQTLCEKGLLRKSE